MRLISVPLSSAQRTSKGIVLLEVLLAFVILSISLGVLLQTTGNSLSRHRAADNQIKAVSLAANLMADFELSKISANQLSGKIDDNFSWRILLRPIFSPEVKLNHNESKLILMAINLEVFWRENGREKNYQLNTKRIVRRAP